MRTKVIQILTIVEGTWWYPETGNITYPNIDRLVTNKDSQP